MHGGKPIPDAVAAEILGQHFRLTRVAVVGLVFFAIPSVWLLREVLSRQFLALWLASFLLVVVARFVLAGWAGRTGVTAANYRTLASLSVVGSGLMGLAWGVLAANALLLGSSYPAGGLLAILIFITGTTFQASSATNHWPAFIANVACLSTPLVVAGLVQDSDRYPAFGAFVLVYLGAMVVVARHTQKGAADAYARRHENERLLVDLQRQKADVDTAHAAKTAFLAAASHDLRQPMHAITLLVEHLADRVHEPELRRTVGSIRSSVETMAALLNSLLDISRFDAGAIKPERRHLRIGDLLERLVAGHAELAASRGLELRLVRSRAVIESDSALLYRIIANFTSNALRYTERGTVLVGCRRRRTGLEIQVWDTGPGIPADRHQDVFREFVQLGNPHRDREQGLGLGLAIVDRTARLLGHPVGLRSAVSEGSMFSVTVPFGNPELVSAGHAPVEPAGTLEGVVAMIVDDERDVRSAMATLLESWGCKVLAAASGREALEMARSSSRVPDVVLADYRLPGSMDGLEVIRRLREQHPFAAGVLVTGDIAPELLSRTEKEGYWLLHKPLRPARLRSLMGNIRRAQGEARSMPARRDAHSTAAEAST
jgi:signal transduction histidine kinase/CheY-like chemotaxis protein